MKQSDDYDLECERCGDLVDALFKSYKAREGMTYLYEEDGSSIPEMEWVEVWICEKCINELANCRGGMDDDPFEIQCNEEKRLMSLIQ